VITRAEMAAHMSKVFKECQDLRAAGQKEYAHNDANAIENFERGAQEVGIDRKQVLWIYMRKHYDGVVAYLKGHKSQRESVHGRIKDMIVYLVLLDAMITEDEETEKLEDNAHFTQGYIPSDQRNNA
jgi:hypothetical protein